MNTLLGRAAAAAVATALLTACGSMTTPDHQSPGSMPGMDHSAGGMPSMGVTPSTGLAAEVNGYRLVPAATTLPSETTQVRFTIVAPDGKPLTAYELDQTQKLHFYAIHDSLTGFQHVHATLGTDGTWTAPVENLYPGTWRIYASFVPASGPGTGDDLVLSTTFKVPGAVIVEPVPVATGTAEVDGYAVKVAGSPTSAGMGMLSARITHGGRPVTDLQPYLDTYAHLTAIRHGDQAFAHLHPMSAATAAHGGPALTFHTAFPESGQWRLFLQFKTGSVLHTAIMDLTVD